MKLRSYEEDNLIWFQLDTDDEEDKLMEMFAAELKLNVKHQLGLEFKIQREENE